MDIVHLHINSKNNQYNSSTGSYGIYLPAEMVKIDEGDWYLQINNFYTINNWYCLQSNYNDAYILNVNGVETTYQLPEGNPRVTDIVTYLNNTHNTLMKVSYDYIKNKLYFYNLSGGSLKIKPVTCGKFIGCFDDIYLDILTGTFSNSVVNVSGDSVLLFHITNSDFGLTNLSLDNLNNDDETGLFKASQIILTVPINVPPFSLINYSSTGDILDRHKIYSQSSSIQNFHIQITNEHGKIIPNMVDYNLSLSFIRQDEQYHNQQIVSSLNKIGMKLNDIFILFMNFVTDIKNRFF